MFKEKLEDVQVELEKHKPLPTWSGTFPISRIDHVFISKGIKILSVEVPITRLTKVASDHLPLITDLELDDKEYRD